MLESSYTHFILYAKNHYQRHDLVDDLKKLITIRSGIDAQYIRLGDIASVLLNAYEDIRGGENVSENHFREILLEKLNPKSLVNTMCKVESEYHVMLFNTILSMIAISPVLDKNGQRIINIGKPDKNILPLIQNKQPGDH